MAFELQRFHVSERKDGSYTFSAMMQALNFNAATVTDQNAASGRSTLQENLIKQGKNILIKEITLSYVGSAGGIVIIPGVVIGTGFASYLGSKQTAYALDGLAWSGIHACGSLEDWPAYMFFVTVTGYAATDDMYVSIAGEVW